MPYVGIKHKYIPHSLFAIVTAKFENIQMHVFHGFHLKFWKKKNLRLSIINVKKILEFISLSIFSFHCIQERIYKCLECMLRVKLEHLSWQDMPLGSWGGYKGLI